MYPYVAVCLLLTVVSPYIWATDPVFSPTTLSDATGNTADTDSVITWADLPSGTPYHGGSTERVSEGLEPYYNLVHSFIGTVFAKGIPSDIIEKAANGNLGDVPGNYNEYISYLIGYAICIGIGVLFILIFPIVACCFCCCRCCGKCGGRMEQSEKDADNGCKKLVFIVILIIIMAFLVTGAICIYVNNDNTSDAINSITTTTNKNLGDIKTYVNNTLAEVNHIAVNNFNFLKDVLFRDLNNVAYLVGLPLRTDIETNTNIRTTLTAAYTLASDLDTADTALADVESKVTALDTAITNLNTALATSRTNIGNIFTTCGVSCPTPQPDYNVNSGVDSSMLPDLSGVRTSMDTAVATNLTQKLVDAEDQLDDIPNRVATDSNSTIQSLKTTISDLSDEIDPVVDEVKNLQNTVIGSNASIDLDKLETDIDDMGDLIKEYDEYRWQGGLGLACVVLLVIVLAVGGLLCGCMGSCGRTPPSKRGFVSNLGGILLMASVGFVCIFSAFLMLLTMLTFIVGAPAHAFICKPVTDLDYMDELWQTFSDAKVGSGQYYMGDLVLNNKSIALTLTGMLRDCKAEKSAMSAFKLDTKFNFEDMLNYSKTLDPEKEIDGVTVDFSAVDVYPTSLQNQLSDAASAVDVNFTAFYEELNKSPTDISLTSLADDLDAYAASVSDPYKTDLETEATTLRTIESTEYAAVVSSITNLNTSLAALENAVSSLPGQISSLQAGLTTTDNYVNNNASASVKSLLTTYALRLIAPVDSFTTFTLDAIKNKLGPCLPVWNVYDALMVHTLCFNIMDTFNGFWFSLGWCIFFFMPGIIFSVKLAKYFRRMNESPSNRVSPAPSEKGGYLNYPQVNSVEPPIRSKFHAAHFSSSLNANNTYGEQVNEESNCSRSDRAFTPEENQRDKGTDIHVAEDREIVHPSTYLGPHQEHDPSVHYTESDRPLTPIQVQDNTTNTAGINKPIITSPEYSENDKDIPQDLLQDSVINNAESDNKQPQVEMQDRTNETNEATYYKTNDTEKEPGIITEIKMDGEAVQNVKESGDYGTETLNTSELIETSKNNKDLKSEQDEVEMIDLEENVIDPEDNETYSMGTVKHDGTNDIASDVKSEHDQGSSGNVNDMAHIDETNTSINSRDASIIDVKEVEDTVTGHSFSPSFIHTREMIALKPTY